MDAVLFFFVASPLVAGGAREGTSQRVCVFFLSSGGWEKIKLNPFIRAPKSLPILTLSKFVPQKGF